MEGNSTQRYLLDIYVDICHNSFYWIEVFVSGFRACWMQSDSRTVIARANVITVITN